MKLKFHTRQMTTQFVTKATLCLSLLFLVGALVLVMVSDDSKPVSAAGVIFVDRNATGVNNGSSWADAYISLQDALAAARSGDQLWVAAGVYYPDMGLVQIDNDPHSTFRLKNGVALYGGFAGTEATLAERNWQTHVTVLSGDIDGNDTVDANGIVTSWVDLSGSNAFHVITGIGTDAGAVLDGFTVTAGNSDIYGGGMYNVNGSPTVINVSFTGNRANSDGGGVFSEGGNPALTNVSFVGNQASRGDDVFNEEGGNPTLVNGLDVLSTTHQVPMQARR